VIGVHATGREACLSIGIAPRGCFAKTIFPDNRPAGIGHDTGGAELVFEQIVHRVAATADFDPHTCTPDLLGKSHLRAA
jgi:hypothetical protein